MAANGGHPGDPGHPGNPNTAHTRSRRRLRALASLALVALALAGIRFFQRHPHASLASTAPGIPGIPGIPGTPGSTTAPTAAPGPAVEQSTADLIGLTNLARELGRAMPYGRGIVIGHVEGQPGDYLPQTKSDDYQNVAFSILSGPSQVNGHSELTTHILVGQQGLAPGVSQVSCYTAVHWMGGGYLNTMAPLAPVTNPIRLFTHSWIAGESPAAANILRRLDYLADARGVMMVVGVNNGASSAVPPLLASAYNTISVGQWDGRSSGGYTTVEGAGRCKPEIVAPGGLTSFSTPVVAAVVARLMEAAERPEMDPAARRPQVLKAVLLAGADKPSDWHQEPGKPLDNHLGAGRVRADRSYHILAAGQPPAPATQPSEEPVSSQPAAQPAPAPGAPAAAVSPAAHPRGQVVPATLRSRYGWAYANLGPGQEHSFSFSSAHAMGEASLVLVWHRRIDGRMAQDFFTGRPYWSDLPRLAHFHLALLVRNDAGRETVAAESASAVDNLQHVYLPTLEPGRYRVRVTRVDNLAEPWDYAVAWRVEEAPHSE